MAVASGFVIPAALLLAWRRKRLAAQQRQQQQFFGVSQGQAIPVGPISHQEMSVFSNQAYIPGQQQPPGYSGPQPPLYPGAVGSGAAAPIGGWQGGLLRKGAPKADLHGLPRSLALRVSQIWLPPSCALRSRRCISTGHRLSAAFLPNPADGRPLRRSASPSAPSGVRQRRAGRAGAR